jgi:hypothetical protein
MVLKKKDKTEICQICRLLINLNKDNYVRVTDYFNGNFYSEGFYHNACYNQRLKQFNAMSNMTIALGEKAGKLLDMYGGDDMNKKEFVIQ